MKTLSFIYILLYLFPLTLAGQSSKPDADFSFGVNFSADYCYRTIIKNSNDEIHAFIEKSRNENENPVFGFTSGLNLNYKINNRVSVETGLHYSKKGYGVKFKKSDLFFGDQIDPRYGFTYDSIPSHLTNMEQISIFYYHHSIDIPLQLKMIAGKKKIRFISGIGLITNILLDATQKSVIKYEDGSKNRETSDQLGDFNTVTFSASGSAGISYTLNGNISLLVEPTFRYGLMNISNTPVTAKLWNGGLNFSCYYNL